MNKQIAALALAVGINPHNKTVQQIEAEHNEQMLAAGFVDQHNMKLCNAIEKLK